MNIAMASRQAMLLLLLLGSACSDAGDRAFDSREWRNADTVSSRVRAEMLGDLQARYKMKGMSGSDVMAILGQPTTSDKFRDWDIVYVLGPYGMDYEWLVIRLNEDHRVTEYKVVGD